MDGSPGLSILVIDEESAILEFIARILDGNGMRALLAHSAEEAIEIAARGYVPIDLILTDVTVKESVRDSGVAEISGSELVGRVREIRPGTRALYVSAFMEGGIIRIQLLNGRQGEDADSGANLLESIASAVNAPLTFGNCSGMVQ